MWCGDTVKSALVDAYAIMRATAGRVGPKAGGNGMPAYLQEDVSDSSDNDDEPRKDDDDGRKPRRLFRPEEIARMEIVMLGHTDRAGTDHMMWIGGILPGDVGPRNCLEAYAVQSSFWALKGKRFNEKRFCRRVGWNYNTYISRRDRGAEILAHKLNAAGVSCWFESRRTPLQIAEKAHQTRRAVPLDIHIMDLIKEKPRTRSQCVTYAVSNGFASGAHAVKIALTKLKNDGQIRKRADGVYFAA